MHVSRNKCELLAECCITGVKPEYKEYDNVFANSVFVKDININKIATLYNVLQQAYRLSIEDFEMITQLFYTVLNDYDYSFQSTLNILAQINSDLVVAKEELEQINKYRELEEGISYV